MKKKIIVLCLLFTCSNFLYSDNIEELFNQANSSYKNADYQKAIELYKEIIQNGYESAEIYYNLGNAYYRLVKIPHSILYYERAHKLSPEDSEIRFNLHIANLRIIDKIEPIPKFFLTEWLESLQNYFSSSRWATITIFLSWLTFIALAAFLLFISSILRKTFFAIAVISALLCMLSLFFSIETNKFENSRDSAIVFSPSVTVKSSPNMNSVTLFTLHEGTKLQIIDRLSDWVKIKIADGNIGWIPEKAIELI